MLKKNIFDMLEDNDYKLDIDNDWILTTNLIDDSVIISGNQGGLLLLCEQIAILVVNGFFGKHIHLDELNLFDKAEIFFIIEKKHLEDKLNNHTLKVKPSLYLENIDLHKLLIQDEYKIDLEEIPYLEFIIFNDNFPEAMISGNNAGLLQITNDIINFALNSKCQENIVFNNQFFDKNNAVLVIQKL